MNLDDVTAGNMRTLSERSLLTLKEDEFRKIRNLIHNAANSGAYYIQCDIKYPETENMLKDLGFKFKIMTFNKDVTTYKITWWID